MMTLILLASFLGLMVLRVPVTMAIGLSVLIALIYAGFADALYIIPLQVLEGVSNASLLAIPFFVLTGNLMNGVGMTDRIYAFASALVGHYRAGLAQVNIVGSMLFAGSTGAAVADCAGLGTIEIKAMRDHGYPGPFSAALTAASSIVGGIIPPSIILVIYAYLSGTSVARLFLAGILPGVLVGLCLMAYVYMISFHHNFPREPKKTLREIGAAALDGIAALAAPGIIMAAILTGFTTVTEAGVLACFYVIILGLLYRTFSMRMLWTALFETMKITTIIMIIIGFSHVMGWLLAIEQVPQQLAQHVLVWTDSKWLFLLLLVVFLMLIGCFVEGIPAMLILVPVLLPVIDQFDIDRVHFGLIISTSLLIGLVTPPIGVALYIVAEVGKVPFERVAVAILPMLVPLTIALLLITFVPKVVTIVPDLILGPG